VNAERTKPLYVRTGKVIDDVRAVARDHGYAVAVHGSLRAERDIDLIAAPWVKSAHAASTLVRAIAELPYLERKKRDPAGDPRGRVFPVAKPHGRLGWIFHVTHRARGCPAYVDLSVMPRG
jgi:hypothetical protein